MAKRNGAPQDRKEIRLSRAVAPRFITVHNGRETRLVNLASVRTIITEPWGDGELVRIIFNRSAREENEDPFYVGETFKEVSDLIAAAG